MQRLVVFLTLVLAVTGCVSPAGKLDESLVAQIRDGSSTRQEVERVFGQPKSSITGSNDKEVAVYQFFRMYEKDDPMSAKRVRRRIHLRMLSVLYGKDNRVEKHHLYESDTKGSATATGARVGSSVRPAQLALINKGSTTREDLIEYLGNPLGEHLTVEGELMLIWLYLEGNGPMSFAPRAQILEVILNEGGTVHDFQVVQDANLQHRL